MNRPLSETKPNKVKISYNYNKVILLESVYGIERAELNTYVRNIDYNENRQEYDMVMGDQLIMLRVPPKKKE